jgi:hypothetical protein
MHKGRAATVGALYEAVSGQYPLLEGGVAAPSNERFATLDRAQRGRSERLPQQVFDLPGRAESKVAFHLFTRRVHPSWEEGIVPFSCVRSFPTVRFPEKGAPSPCR